MTPATLDLICTRGVTFGPVVILCSDDTPVVVDLTGWTPIAHVRKKSGSALIFDLAPTVTDGPAGEITIPAMADEDTMQLPAGSYRWDLVLERPTGERLGPYIAGRFTVANIITQPS